ncbi:MAG TPA: hypothetical protein VKZ96_06620 [Thermomicrobiales bacterium]|nr:hypothetical protein [Thermomicrobiales bacterium]
MAKADKINELVQTVRKLNWEVRPKLTNTPGGNSPDDPLHRALTDLRNNEIQMSQQIRAMSLAESDVTVDEANIIEHAEAAKVSSRQLLSEFGTAREAILSLLRNFSDEDWTREHSTSTGSVSIDKIVDDLIASDKQYMERIFSAAAS